MTALDETGFTALLRLFMSVVDADIDVAPAR